MLRVLDYTVTISFRYTLYCVYFNLFCNVWVCICVRVLVVYTPLLVFTVFCIVCTVLLHCFVYVYLFLFVLSAPV
jgi:hypothetical protein